MRLLRCTSLLLSAICLHGYQAQAPAGVAAVWDVRADTTNLAESVRKLEPLLKQLKPDEWVAKGASGTYIRQAQSAQRSMQALFDATDRLLKEPERLSAAIETYFLMERMEMLLNSLKQGVRRYASSDLADQMDFLLSENSIHRDKLKQHVQDLAVTREQEFQLMDKEAQRCRGMISQQGSGVPKSERRRDRTHD